MNSGIKYVLGISIILCAYAYGNEEQKQDCGSLRIALNQADTENTPFILHQFDIKYPEKENKSILTRDKIRKICRDAIDRIWFGKDNSAHLITGEEMHMTCRNAISSMRGQRDLYKVYDYVITGYDVSCYNANHWDIHKPNFDIITESDVAGDRILYIYNISEDTTLSTQEHVTRIEKLKNGKVIVNIAKKRWNEMCDAMKIDERKDVFVFGTIPSHFLYRYKNILLISGSIVLALLALVSYVSHVSHNYV